MTITEIVNTIFEERVQIEVYEILQKWLIEDRAEWIKRCMDSEATGRAVRKILEGNKNKTEAINGAVNLLDGYKELYK